MSRPQGRWGGLGSGISRVAREKKKKEAEKRDLELIYRASRISSGPQEKNN